MTFFPVVNEACRVLDEGIAVKAADLDISAVMGMGFPPYRFVSSLTFLGGTFPTPKVTSEVHIQFFFFLCCANVYFQRKTVFFLEMWGR